MGHLYIFTSLKSFNTQPPEGGWPTKGLPITPGGCFNTQPPEGGWDNGDNAVVLSGVSTHSRPKAAGAT